MRHGFTLVELSVVLVIIGLVAGSVIGGQSLIHASQLRGIVTEAEAFRSAVFTFKGTYEYLPGDLPNATEYWGAVKAGGGCDTTASSVGTPTCNGDGDRRIGQTGGASQYGEMFTFWQQLANAELIDGVYSGQAGSANNRAHLQEQNAPASGLPEATWCAFFRPNAPGMFQIDYGNTLQLGIIDGSTDGTPTGDLLTPKEMWSIDQKTDDGKPAKGDFVSMRFADCTTATANTQTDATYNLDATDKECFVVFRNAFQ